MNNAMSKLNSIATHVMDIVPEALNTDAAGLTLSQAYFLTQDAIKVSKAASLLLDRIRRIEESK